MSTNFFSHEVTGRKPLEDPESGLEAQQATVVRMLRKADGAVVSYDELRDAGIELPASVVSELELAGFPVDRRRDRSGHPGVRLEPALDAGRAAPPDEGSADAAAAAPASAHRSWTHRVHVPRLSRGWFAAVDQRSETRSLHIPDITRLHIPDISRLPVPDISRLPVPRVSRRSLAPLALIAIATLIVMVVVLGLTAGRAHPSRLAHRPAPRHHSAPRTKIIARAPKATTQKQQPQQQPPLATPVSPGLATQFEAEGHNLLEQGQYDQAVPVLRRAVQATGEQLTNCLEPVSQTCLTYAYALYDLGRALQLNGQPNAAVPILEQRLQIDNQRGVVQSELDVARSAVG